MRNIKKKKNLIIKMITSKGIKKYKKINHEIKEEKK